MNPLEEYAGKRNSDKTPEPMATGPKKAAKGGNLRFVVHKHAASSTHYDLRLEVGGVLKSWAVPKGPSQDPLAKHLAVQVEDHPFAYKDFEGVIPQGNYGAGPVMIWDEGYYRPIGRLASKNLEEAFAKGLADGHLVFALAGQKLNGEFALIKLRKGSKNDWLLVKARDWYASEDDILLEDRSARSGRTMDEIQKAARKLPTIVPDFPKADMPHHIRPMLATLTDKPFDDKDWSFEIKWDGYRAITEISHGVANIYSRNNLSFNDRFPSLVASLNGFAKDVVFDGEIVVVDKAGRSSFQLLQEYKGSGNLIYYIFDLLYYDGYDLSTWTLKQRRNLLAKIIPPADNIRYSDDITNQGIGFYNLTVARGLEGIVAKRSQSTYQAGRRSSDWLKIKISMQQEAIICGYTAPRGSRTGFGSLVLGAYQGNKLIYIGNVGTGFDEQTIAGLMKRFKPIITPDPPLPTPIKIGTAITWVKPQLVCEVRFLEWTRDGSMRHPVYLGLREDKEATEVFREVPNAG